MIKKILSHTIVGIGLSFIGSIILLNIFTRDMSGAIVLNCALLWLIAGALYGVVSIIYDTKINRNFAMILHFILNLAISLVAVEIMFKIILQVTPEYSYLFLIFIYIVVYALIGTIHFVYEYADVKKLNQKMQVNKHIQKEDN